MKKIAWILVWVILLIIWLVVFVLLSNDGLLTLIKTEIAMQEEGSTTTSSTPEWIDPIPLYTIKLPKGLDVLANIPSDVHTNSPEFSSVEDGAMIFVHPLNATNEDVYRTIEIYQFYWAKEALQEYENYKEIFSDGENNNLYKSDGKDNERYFMAYKSARINRNHGFAIGIINAPDITLWFLKNNIFISISYHGYENYDSYVEEMNSDVVYVADILKRIIANKEQK